MRKIQKLLFLIAGLFMSNLSGYAQCPNIDFETGTYYPGWNYSTGTCCGIAGMIPTAPAPPDFTIMSSGLDGPVSVVGPGTGIYTLRLGHEGNTNSAQRVSYNVTVPWGVTSYYLTYRYAILIEVDAAHPVINRAHFRMSAYDAADGALIPCAQHLYVADGAIPGFLPDPAVFVPPGFLPVEYYKDWAQASIDLSGYAGRTITVEFTVAGCGLGGHSCHAYIDMECTPLPSVVDKCAGTADVLNAPPGYATYTWYDAAGTPIGVGETLPITVPFTSTTYVVHMTPFPGFGCPSTYSVTINPILPPLAGAMAPMVLCEGESKPVVFTAPRTTGGSVSWEPGITFSPSPVWTITGVSAGASYYTYTVSNICGTASAVGAVLVNPLPNVPTVTVSPGPHCEGSPITFTVHGQPGMEIYYEILPYPTGGPVPLLSTAILTGGVFSVTVPGVVPSTSLNLVKIVNPATGCWRMIGMEYPVTVCPILKAGEISGPNPLCAGSYGTYTTTGDPGGYWTVDGSLGSIGTLSGNFRPHGHVSGTVTITYQNSNCCNSVMTTYNVLVSPTPSMPTLVYTGCVTPCPGTTLTYNIVGDPGSEVTWEWLDPGFGTHPGGTVSIPSSGPPVVSISIPTTVLGTYYINIIEAYFPGPLRCTNNGGFMQTIDVKWPHADFSQSPASICAGDPVVIAVTGSMGSCSSGGLVGLPVGTVYVTDLTSGTVIPITLTSIPGGSGTGWGSVIVYPTVTTTYQITGAATFVCSHLFPGSTMTVIVKPLPAITLTSSAPPICYGSLFTLSASCLTCTEPYNWAGPDLSYLPATTPGGTPTPSYSIPWAAYSGIYSVTGSEFHQDIGLTCTATATTPVNIEKEPTASMSCESYCNSEGVSVVDLHFSGTAGHLVTFTDGVTSWSETLNPSGLATATMPITGTTFFYITSVVDPLTGCYNMSSPPGCTVEPITMPSVSCYSYTDAEGIWHIELHCPTATVSDPVRVNFLGHVFDGIFSCSATTFVDLVAPSTAITACMVTPAGCDPSGPPCIAAWCTGIFVSSIEYNGCFWEYATSCAMSKPGVQDDNMHFENQALSISPNPNTGTFTVSGSVACMTANETVTIEIMDVLGRTIYTNDAQLNNGKLDMKVIISEDVANGTYLLKVKNSKANEVIRFTLNR